MPDVRAFEAAFGLRELPPLDGFTLDTVETGHKVLSRFHSYEFPVRIAFRAPQKRASTAALLKRLRDVTKNEALVYSNHGSPYRCSLGPPNLASSTEGAVVIRMTGLATRTYDVQTLKQQAAAQPEWQLSKEAREVMEERGMRVKTSRFSTGVCATCEEAILPGVLIAQQGAPHRGGWSHAVCAAEAEGIVDPTPAPPAAKRPRSAPGLR
jgi:hypothetical protein